MPFHTTLNDDSVEENDVYQPSNTNGKKRSLTIQIPAAALSKLMTPVAERCGISIRAQLQVTSALIVNSGGSINDVPLPVGSIHRHRLQALDKFLI